MPVEAAEDVEGDRRVVGQHHADIGEAELEVRPVRRVRHLVAGRAGGDVVMDGRRLVARRRLAVVEDGEVDGADVAARAGRTGRLRQRNQRSALGILPHQVVGVARSIGVGDGVEDLRIGILEVAGRQPARQVLAEGVVRVPVPVVVEVGRVRRQRIERGAGGAVEAAGEAGQELGQDRAPLVVLAGIHAVRAARERGVVENPVRLRVGRVGVDRDVAQGRIDAVGKIVGRDLDVALDLAVRLRAEPEDVLGGVPFQAVGVERGVVPDVVRVGRAVVEAGERDAGVGDFKGRDVVVPVGRLEGRVRRVLRDGLGGRVGHARIVYQRAAVVMVDTVAVADRRELVEQVRGRGVVAPRARRAIAVGDAHLHRQAETVHRGQVADVVGAVPERDLDAVVAHVPGVGAAPVDVALLGDQRLQVIGVS